MNISIRHIKKITSVVGALVLSTALIAGCSSSKGASSGASSHQDSHNSHQITTIKVAGPIAPLTMPMLRMKEANLMGKNVKIEFKQWKSPDELISLIQGGDYQFFATPLNLGATLYNKSGAVRQVLVSAWDVLSLISTDPSIKSVADLKGQTIYAPANTPIELTLKVVLKANGIDPQKDVRFVDVPIGTAGAQLLASGKAKNLMVVQPAATAIMAKLKDKHPHSVIDFKAEWKKVVHNPDALIPTAGITVKSPFAKQHPDIVKKFQQAYAEASKWCKDNPQGVGQLADKYLQGIPGKIYAQATPHITWAPKNAVDAQADEESYFKQLAAVNPNVIGGKLPNAHFYFDAK